MAVQKASYNLRICYSQAKEFTIGNCITSPIFSIGGYDWTVLCYPRGTYYTDKGNYMSLYVHLVHESINSVTVKYELGVLDKDGELSFEDSKSMISFFSSKTPFHGHQRFIKIVDLEKNYIKDDSLTIVASISIDVTGKSSKQVQRRGLSNLPEHIGKLMKKKETTDVTFKVEREKFPAHKLILAARSPVFEAEFFGAMAEAQLKCVTITDMKAATFQALLHFIYTDSLPNWVGVETSHTALFVAADRYQIDGLRTYCIDKLTSDITFDNVISILTIAEQRYCKQLKDACFNFIADPTNLSRVMLTDEYMLMMYKYPSLLDELRVKVGQTSS